MMFRGLTTEIYFFVRFRVGELTREIYLQIFCHKFQKIKIKKCPTIFEYSSLHKVYNHLSV